MAQNKSKGYYQRGRRWQVDTYYSGFRIREMVSTEEMARKVLQKTRTLIDEDRYLEIKRKSETTLGKFNTVKYVRNKPGEKEKSIIWCANDLHYLPIKLENTDDDGSITLQLPRVSIDAKKTDDADDTFIILIDGIEVPYEEKVTNQQARTITIEFEQGDSDIEIIGTFVIPEFGNVVMWVLVLAIISTILISTKKRILIR